MISNFMSDNSTDKILSHSTSNVLIGYWFCDKKEQRFGVNHLIESCRKRCLDLAKIDLDHDFNKWKYSVILHKLTPIIALALHGDIKSKEILSKVEKFKACNPKVLIIDPVQSAQKLLLRPDTYSLLMTITKNTGQIFTPNYAQLIHKDKENFSHLLEKNYVTFPVVCKPLYAGGCSQAHEMAIFFNEDQLREHCMLPCVAQSFINHGGVLYKVFVIGTRWFLTTRPSLKNFLRTDDCDAIFFNSHHISKADSHSPLNQSSKEVDSHKADIFVLEKIVMLIKEALKSELLGIDIIIDGETGNYAIIDINAFPSYDSVPNVMDHIADMVRKRIDFGEDFSAKLEFNFCVDVEFKYISEEFLSNNRNANGAKNVTNGTNV